MIKKILTSLVAAASLVSIAHAEVCTASAPCSTRYSYNNNQTTITDPNGNVTVDTYRSFGDPDQKQLTQSNVAHNCVITDIGRDAMGRVKTIRQHASCANPATDYTRSYQYDSHYFLTGEDNPETGHTTYGRDGIGEMTSKKVGSSSIVSFRYDKLGQLTQTLNPASDLNRNVIISYDTDGHVKNIHNGNSTWHSTWGYTYDANGNLTNATLSFPPGNNTPSLNKSLAFKYSYDGLDHLSNVTYPDGTKVDYAPDALGRITKAGGFVTSVHYFPNGKVQDFTDGNGIKTTYALNDRQMDNEITVSNSIIHRQYTYDGDGNTTAIKDLLNPTRSRTFGYDPENWLIWESTNGGPKLYTSHDASGNFLDRRSDNLTLHYNYDLKKNLLTSVTGTVKTLTGTHNVSEHYTYDAYGDITSTDGSGKQFVYNDAQQLMQVHGKNSIDGKEFNANYYYDGNGNRVQITKGDETTLAVYNRKNQLLYQENLKTNTATDYIDILGKKVAHVDHKIGQVGTPSEVTYLHDDLLGSPLQATNDSGAKLWSSGQEYRPFGSELYKTTQRENHVGFTGKLHDDATGLSYYGARYYDPVIGRFMSVDPVGFKADSPISFNRYAYAGDNPLKYVDPDGQYPEDISSMNGQFEAALEHADVSVSPSVSSGPNAASNPLGSLNQMTQKEQQISVSALSAMARGRRSEARVLNDMGLKKNTNLVSNKFGTSIPDAIGKGQVVEVKDTKRVGYTKQIRVQQEYARQKNLAMNIVTGTKTKISSRLAAQNEAGRLSVSTRGDLGPQSHQSSTHEGGDHGSTHENGSSGSSSSKEGNSSS